MTTKRIALVDCDGVLADFSRDALRAVDSTLRPWDITEWDIFKLLELEQVGKGLALREALNDPDFWRWMHPLPGSYALLEGLRNNNHEVVAVTSPWLTCAGWDKARRDWLRENFDIPPENVIITARKDLVVGNVFFDDKPEHVVAWGNRHGYDHAWLVDAPYNRDADYGRRMLLGGM